MTDTPRTKAIVDCFRQSFNESDHERSHALREAAEIALEDLERELTAAQARIAELERGENPASQEFYDIAYRDGVRGGLSYAADLMGGEGEDAARRMLFAEAAKYDNQRAASVKGIKDEGWDAFYQLRKQVAGGVYGDILKNQVISMEVKESP